MADQDEEQSKDKPDSTFVEFVRISEEGKTKRTWIICGTIAFGILAISFVVIQLTTPTWQFILTAIMTALGLPTVVTRIMIEAYDRNSKKGNRRTASLELQIDPNRTSSLFSSSPTSKDDGTGMSNQEKENDE